MSNAVIQKQLDEASNPGSTGNNEPEQIMDTPISLGDWVPAITDLLPDFLKPYWELIQQYPLLEGFTILFIFLLLAYLIRSYAIKLIEYLAQKTETHLDDAIVAEVRGPIFSTVVWIGLNVACVAAGFAMGAGRFITPIIMTIIVFIWLRVGMALSTTIFTGLSRDHANFKKVDIRTEPLFIIGAKILVLLISSYAILVIWGINPVGLLASAGIVGLAVGFAAKDSLANLFSGVFILADRPYKLGDYINLESGERGKVTHIGIRSTRMLTRDDIEISVPNGIIGNAKIINESGGPQHKMRIRISVQVAYGTNLERMSEILMEVAAARPRVSKHPTPRVRVRGFADCGINVQLLCWIEEPEERGLVTHLLYQDIHTAFADHGIEIPYPRSELYMLND